MRLAHNSIRRAAAVLAVVGASMLAGCTAVVSPDGALSVATGQEHYQRSAPDQRTAVTFSAKNAADDRRGMTERRSRTRLSSSNAGRGFA